MLKLIFNEQGNNPDYIRRRGFSDLALSFLVNHGVQEGVEPGFFCGLRKDTLAQQASVQRAVGIHDVGPEMCSDSIKPR
ncbi:hypothetical protein D3C76_1648330 [compost metagenome]